MAVKPLLILDCNNVVETACPHVAGRMDLFEWLLDQGIEPKVTHRLEYFVIDAPFVRVFQIDADSSGRWLNKLRAPFDVIISSPPPACPYCRVEP